MVETTVTDGDVIVARASQLFAEELPDIEVPCPCQLHRWLAKGGGDAAVLYRAIHRAAGKKKAEANFFGHEMGSDEVASFIVRILRRETPDRKAERRMP